MDTTDPKDIAAFGRLFNAFLEQLVYKEPVSESRSLLHRLRDHLGYPPAETPVVKASHPPYQHANVHLALERWFSTEGRSHELIGVAGESRRHESLAEILETAQRYGRYRVGPVDYAYTPVSTDEELACVSFGIYLGVDGDDRYAVLLRGPSGEYDGNVVQIEVLAPSRDAAKRLLSGLDQLIREHNVFRGKVISFEGSDFGEGIGPFRFHHRPALGPGDIVLPDGLLARVERQIVGVARRRERLRATGQHLRRGLLLYGPPGTGKTHSIRYLLSQLPDFTVVLLSGTTIQHVAAACALARQLQPALVVLEDCDLVAEARDFSDGEQPLLFQVLNEMDGLGDDADVAFLLTTNRADLLEPALAQRPGRVDMAVEIPLPDATGRRRLLDLYGGMLALDEPTARLVIDRTAGTTASFSKELVRRTVLFAAERDSDEVTRDDLLAALDELLSDQDALTRRLLGVPDPDGDGHGDGDGDGANTDTDEDTDDA
ncbi:ATP-binding protein [Streptomyces sp. LX-29]|uniref:AAA family ATPase n=1 Tax=Streptomyces sp. LX-29 TaxID=2900152 RepID=UPI00240E910B|nr:ATP-binding protein [Streptomyces sp. LX-29]WFB06428.1 ATP-binding protein [Streptomyces sp. LX-29]